MDVDYTTNAEWFRVQQGTGTESAMKAALHKGSMKDLNVYSARPNGSGGEAIAGFTKLPMFAQVPSSSEGCTFPVADVQDVIFGDITSAGPCLDHPCRICLSCANCCHVGEPTCAKFLRVG